MRLEPLTDEQIKILRKRRCERCGKKGVSLVYGDFKEKLCTECLTSVYEGG